MWSPIKKAPPASEEAQEAPIPMIVSGIIHQAIRENATSIQLVPTEEGMRVEYLKEGVWHQTMLMPKNLELVNTTHLKVMAGLPTEYRMAMQGLIVTRYSSAMIPGERDYDLHLFITPTRQGEKITLNIEAVGGSPE